MHKTPKQKSFKEASPGGQLIALTFLIERTLWDIQAGIINNHPIPGMLMLIKLNQIQRILKTMHHGEWAE